MTTATLMKDLAAAVARGLAPSFHEIGRRLAALDTKERGLDGRDGGPGPRGPEGPAGVPGRDGVPGAPGAQGRDGAAGVHGKDGTDGLGFGDLAVVQESERTFRVRATRGDQTKDLGTVTLAVAIYRGVYADGTTHERGDLVTWGGSVWHCNEPTGMKPGDGAKAWTLMVKRGRDGKDGTPGADGRPGRDLGAK